MGQTIKEMGLWGPFFFKPPQGLGYLLDWLAECHLGSPTMSISNQKGQKPGHCSVPTAGCLSSHNLALKAQKISGELPAFISHWKVKARSQYRQRNAAREMDLPKGMRASGQKQRFFLLPFIWAAPGRCCLHLGWEIPLPII